MPFLCNPLVVSGLGEITCKVGRLSFLLSMVGQCVVFWSVVENLC